MQTFKQADFLINICLVTAFAVTVIIHPSLLFTAYYIVGGWQLVSIIIHSVKGWFLKKGGVRRVYHGIVIIFLAGVVLGQLLTPPVLFFYVLLIGSPLLALLYTMLCYVELKEIKRVHSFNLR